MSTSYQVITESYAERHFIKNFQKKYKTAWSITWRAILEEFKRFDTLIDTPIADLISRKESIIICKTEFRVAGTKDSSKSSGNRCIIAVNKNSAKVKILLVYNKNDLSGRNETAEWKQMIRENYPEYKDVFN